ncbi:hypothetical protein [Isorropodon fossajaponicum symbiont]|uniref:hypothetical protein n=1 Tax=Isorropodon fossajaponicum symbiont TaxID=883811 RepID=UPI0019150955|nr:hypothetical protein [Isorropodon fossajaponicum symbiont]
MLTSCLSTIDKGLMSASNAISFVNPVTGKREINFESQVQEIKRANAQSKEILADLKQKKIKINS